MSQKRQQQQQEESCKTQSDGDDFASDDKRRKLPSLNSVASELITLRRMQKLIEPALEPMIRKIVKEEVDLAMKKYLFSIRRTCGKEICSSESGSLQLQFLCGISLPVFTGTRIEGEDFNNLQVALVDPFTGQVVPIGPQSAAKVEIVVLEGDFDGDESDNWTFEEFKNNIVREREGKKPLLTGDAFLTLKEGIGVVSDISFTDNSSWTRSRKFRLGARVVDNSDGNRVKEAKTDSFIVRDHRGELYKKHHPPSLADEVWRLEKIGKDGAFHRRLSKERIKTVKDFLTLYFLDPARLRNILGTGMSTKMWEVTVDHARTCVLDKELHFYYPSGSQHKKGVVFNAVGEVMGFVSDCQYITHDKLSETEKAYARDLVAAAYRHWTVVVSIDDEASLMDGSLFLSTIEYSSNPPMLVTSDGSKVLNSHQSGKCDYPEPNTCSHIMPSMDSLGVLSPLDVHDFPIMDSLENIFGHPLNIPGQVTNNMICDIDSMTPALYEDEHLQFFDSSNLGSSTGLNAAVGCFLGRPKRRWKMLFSVLRWLTIRRMVARKSKVKELAKALTGLWPVQMVGPMVPSAYVEGPMAGDSDYGGSLWKPSDHYLKWLDEKAPKSVVFVSFGSMADVEIKQIEEIACGLKGSNHHFLWVIKDSEQEKLLTEFLQSNDEMGFGKIVKWCNQLEVLAHKSVVCFMTHCGWNSTLEAASLGVPMVALPQWSDQPTNAKFIESVWRVGVRAKRDEKMIVTREEIERCVREVMVGEKSDEIILLEGQLVMVGAQILLSTILLKC